MHLIFKDPFVDQEEENDEEVADYDNYDDYDEAFADLNEILEQNEKEISPLAYFDVPPENLLFFFK